MNQPIAFDDRNEKPSARGSGVERAAAGPLRLSALLLFYSSLSSLSLGGDAEAVSSRLAKATPSVAATAGQATLDGFVAALRAKEGAVDRCWLDCSRDGWRNPGLRQKLLDAVPDPLLHNNLAAAMGRELVRQELLEEADSLLASVKAEKAVDPAALYFHRAACEARLGRRAAATTALDALDRLPNVPVRYRVVAGQIRQTLQTIKPGSLAEIAGEMREVQRRLRLARADQPTRRMQQGVLSKLDKLIAELENEQRQRQPSAAPANPVEESRSFTGKARGAAEEKKFRDFGAWGNLPPKDREKALQSIGRDFPVHYRGAVEEYFRKLATLPAGDAP